MKNFIAFHINDVFKVSMETMNSRLENPENEDAREKNAQLKRSMETVLNVQGKFYFKLYLHILIL